MKDTTKKNSRNQICIFLKISYFAEGNESWQQRIPQSENNNTHIGKENYEAKIKFQFEAEMSCSTYLDLWKLYAFVCLVLLFYDLLCNVLMTSRRTKSVCLSIFLC